MHHWIVLMGTVCLAICISGCGSDNSGGQPEPPSSAPAQIPGDHSAEIQAAIEAGLAAASDSDSVKFYEWFRGMLVPDYEAWCERIFGAEKGAKLASSLGSQRAAEQKLFRDDFVMFDRMKITEVRVVLVQPGQTELPGEAEALRSATPGFRLYRANFFQKGESRPSFSWAGFAWVEDHPRWIGELSSLAYR